MGFVHVFNSASSYRRRRCDCGELDDIQAGDVGGRRKEAGINAHCVVVFITPGDRGSPIRSSSVHEGDDPLEERLDIGFFGILGEGVSRRQPELSGRL